MRSASAKRSDCFLVTCGRGRSVEPVEEVKTCVWLSAGATWRELQRELKGVVTNSHYPLDESDAGLGLLNRNPKARTR